MNHRKLTGPEKDREAFFRALIDHSPDGMVVLDARGVVQFANQAARKPLSDSFPEDEAGPFSIQPLDGYCILNQAEKGAGGMIRCHTAEIDWQGEPYTLVMICEPLPDVADSTLAAQVAQIKAREARCHAFFEHAVNGFVLAKIARDPAGDPIDFKFAQVNRAFEKALNLTRDEILGKSARLFLPNIETMDAWQALKEVAQSGQPMQVQTYSNLFDKHFKLSIYAPIDEYMAVLFNDNTKQVEAENELRWNEAKYRSLFDAMALGVVIQDREGNITAANPAAERILGLPHDYLIGIGSLTYDWQTVKLNGEALPGESHPAMTALRTGQRVRDFILGLFNPKKNSLKWLSVSAVPDFRKGEAEAFQVITAFADITDRIRVQRAFEERVKELRCLTDISSILQKNLSLTEVCEKAVRELVSAMKYSESAFAEIEMAGVEKTTHQDAPPGVNDLIVPIYSSGEKIGQIRVGNFKDLPFVLPEQKDLLKNVADSLSLWYERTMIRQHLEESELRFRRAVMNMPTPVMIHAEDGEIITLNDSWVEISGYRREELPTLSDWIANAYGENDDSVRSVIAKLFALEGPLDEGEFIVRTREGERRVWEFRSAPLGRLPDGRKSVISMGMDTTQRKQAERERESFYERIRALREIDKLIMSSLDMEEVLGRVTSELSRVMQYDSMSVMLIDNGTLEIIAGQGFENLDEIIGLRFPNEPDYPNYDVIQGVQPVTSTQISKDYPKFTQPLREDLSTHVKSWLGVPLISQDGVIGMFAIDRIKRKAFTEEDIQIAMEFANRAAIAIHNAQLYERTGEQLEKLSVLRNIDSVITSSLNLDEVLPVLLRQIKAGLAVDAAAVLLFDDDKGELRFEAGIGFKIQPTTDRLIPLGRGYAGKVARDGEPVFVAEMDYREGGSAYPVNLAREGFISFCALPMIAKGKLLGVLELFHRKRLLLDENWKAFAETLTWQAAIAVDDILMFTALEQANQNLKQAYDATIQGWAKALELRDQETEGHSQRVVALTLALAKEFFGFEGEALRDIRRGVLLHDIGKMAVPDEILRKPGPLTEAEWEVMRQHPVDAYDMLKGIDYLEPALWIPHYHHERWNGAGYPEGLSGEDIPIEARIFAIVDVWDALNSDRPYRDAWPRQEVIAYLQKQSGKEFDPAVVDAFMVLIGEGKR